ncbi:MAG: hypothetical protein U1F77_10160 [Kiritimatiellia bacterium]
MATGNPEAGWPGGIVTRTGFSVDQLLLAGNALNLVDEDNDVLKAPLGSGPAATASGTLNLAGTFTISAWHFLAPCPTMPARYFVFEAEDGLTSPGAFPPAPPMWPTTPKPRSAPSPSAPRPGTTSCMYLKPRVTRPP